MIAWIVARIVWIAVGLIVLGVILSALAQPLPMQVVAGGAQPSQQSAPATQQAPAYQPAPAQSTSSIANPANYGMTLDTAARIDRLTKVDQVFRASGAQAALKAAGFNGTVQSIDARQPEEETVGQTGLYSGSQVTATGSVSYPMCLTTNVPSRVTEKSDTRKYVANVNTGSTLYTNVDVHGAVTVYVDCTNWGQLWPTTTSTSAQPAAAPTTASTSSATSGCMSISDLDAKYGIDRSAQGSRNGLLYDGDTLSGAVLKLTPAQADELSKAGWTVQGSNSSVKSAWSPPSCRPLKN